MLDMPNGATIATAVIGREGALGALSILGPSRSSVTAVVRVGGTASQISVSRFHAAYMGSSAIRDVVQAHTGSIFMQLQHVAACNGLHPVEDRLARWLLELHDRTEGNVLSVTQGTLSQLLGVRRTTITQMIAKTPCRWCYQIRSAGLDRNRQGAARGSELRMLPHHAP
jgi:CRP-like cAMP-binding protein